MNTPREPLQPGPSHWYHQPSMWLFAGLLSSVVIASMVTLWLAISRPDHIVVDDAEYDRIRSELRAQDPAATAPQERDDGSQPR